MTVSGVCTCSRERETERSFCFNKSRVAPRHFTEVCVSGAEGDDENNP